MLINRYNRNSTLDNDLLEIRMPNDTLSFFFFHVDTVRKYPLEILQKDYKILRRYDLSSQDIITLKNQY